MINRVEISGLKSIDTLKLELKNLNMFLGTNSSGKSTIIQGILTISQNINQAEIKLNGGLVSLGEFREVRNFNTNAKSMIRDC
jgi:predicted ATPase